MNYTPILKNPIEWDGIESECCLNCQINLTFEGIQEELKNCFSCTEEIETRIKESKEFTKTNKK